MTARPTGFGRHLPLSSQATEPLCGVSAANGGSESRIKSLWKTLGPSFGYKLGKAITKQDCRDYYGKLDFGNGGKLRDLTLYRTVPIITLGNHPTCEGEIE